MFNKMNPKAAKIILQTPEMEKLSQEELGLSKAAIQHKKKADDNFSSVSFKTVHTGTSIPSGNTISKDKMVF
jgi:hypothetical protein